jgi:fructoselysine 6-kinase
VRVLGFGDNIVDRYLDRGMLYPGGNCVNFAVFARWLGAESSYLGVFGSDEHGRFLREAIEAEGVDTHRSQVKDGPSGVSSISIVQGDRVFGGWNGGGVTVSDPLELNEDLLRYLSGFDLLHSSVYSRSEKELAKARAAGPLISYDFSSEEEFRTTRYFTTVCPSLDLALISCSNLSTAQTQRLLAALVDHGAGMALGTRGESGAVVYDGRNFISAPAAPIPATDHPIDTMGCGDAFLTAFVVSLLGVGWSGSARVDSAEILGALHAGAAFAARQCLVEGAFGRGVADSGIAVTM